MSTLVHCDGPDCDRIEPPDRQLCEAPWMRLDRGGIGPELNFHNESCLAAWMRGPIEPLDPEVVQQEVEVTLRGHIIGGNHELGFYVLRGCDATSGHHPWDYQLHWATTMTPAVGTKP
jgi:hypothetical protein